MSREAMQMALEALEDANDVARMEFSDEDYYSEAINALRKALETEQEPVAWLSEGGDVSRSKRYMDEMGFKCNPLYTAPPKQWVGLTDEDYKELSKIAFVEVIEKIERVLKEKNA
jgi:hypothetical protein